MFRIRFFVAFLLSAGLMPAARADALSDVLDRMDKAAQDFRSFSAGIKRTEYTAVLSEAETSKGSVRVRRSKNGLDGIMEFGEPNARLIHFNGRTFETFYPKANRVEIIDLGKRGGAAEQFLLLGFGASVADIRKNYEVRMGGPEQVNSVATTRIELTPKEGEAKKLITKIELWIPDGQGNPIQEKVTQPSNNYSLFTYLDLKNNPSLPDSAYNLNLPSGVKKIYPQK
jgi:outer membrane lipoprotein-sorting protein